MGVCNISSIVESIVKNKIFVGEHITERHEHGGFKRTGAKTVVVRQPAHQRHLVRIGCCATAHHPGNLAKTGHQGIRGKGNVRRHYTEV